MLISAIICAKIFSGDFMNIKTENNNKNGVCRLTQRDDGNIIYLDFSIDFNTPTVPETVRISWYFSAKDCYSTWNPERLHIHGLDFEWGECTIYSRLASWMPVQSLISKDGTNKLLIAVSDVDTPISIGTGIREEDATLFCNVKFFTKPIAPTTHYEAVIRLDMRDIPYYDSIYDCTAWWENECGYESAYVPESARMPMDSLWYSFHQMLSRDEILKECKASKEIGLDTVIIDDGWQTDDNNRGYAYCGDWQVAESKMGDMRQLVDDIHAIGQKVILWYSVPFVGMYSEKYEEFKDYFLDECGNAGTSYALDPRYKKVRDYLVSTYKNAVTDWNLDGLKLDFIDSFALRGKSLEYDARRDYSSLEEGLHALMSEITDTLKAINPEILIEFRQSYVGPSIRKYGNMLRVGDCPCDILKNRTGVINLRMTSGKTAVHSDMLMWNTEDTAENAALQFTAILYAVPQISVRVDKLPEDHKKMLTHYINFWLKNKEILLDGKLTALNPDSFYSQACSTLGDKAIFTAHTNPVINVKTQQAIAVNASMHDSLIIKNANGKSYKTVNCKGEELDKGTINADVAEIKVPTAGIIYIEWTI